MNRLGILSDCLNYAFEILRFLQNSLEVIAGRIAAVERYFVQHCHSGRVPLIMQTDIIGVLLVTHSV